MHIVHLFSSISLSYEVDWLFPDVQTRVWALVRSAFCLCLYIGDTWFLSSLSSIRWTRSTSGSCFSPTFISMLSSFPMKNWKIWFFLRYCDNVCVHINSLIILNYFEWSEDVFKLILGLFQLFPTLYLAGFAGNERYKWLTRCYDTTEFGCACPVAGSPSGCWWGEGQSL